MGRKLGIDTGGTLTKLAYMNENGQLKLELFPSSEMGKVRDWIEAHPNIDEIGLTGGRTEQLLTILETVKTVQYIVEFEATLKGVKYLLQSEGHEVNEAIITNIGTGTSIHYMNENEHKRISGTGVGGGTLVGLSALMTGITNFDEILTKAAAGKRHEIDLLVKDIYQGMDTPIDGDLTASNFGKVGITDVMSYPVEDKLATIQGLVGEVITTLSIQLAQERELEQIVYIGTTLTNNAHLKEVIRYYTVLKKHKPIFLKNCGFSGAVGALLNVLETEKAD